MLKCGRMTARLQRCGGPVVYSVPATRFAHSGFESRPGALSTGRSEGRQITLWILYSSNKVIKNQVVKGKKRFLSKSTRWIEYKKATHVTLVFYVKKFQHNSGENVNVKIWLTLFAFFAQLQDFIYSEKKNAFFRPTIVLLR